MQRFRMNSWTFVFTLILGVVLGSHSVQARVAPDKRSRLIPALRPVNYVVHTPRKRAQKYVYQVETRRLQQAGQNNQVTASNGSTVQLKIKMNKKRSIASE